MRCCWPPPSMPAAGERVLDLGAGVGAVGPVPGKARAGLHGRRHRAAAGAGRPRRAQRRAQRARRPGANHRPRPRPAAAGRARPVRPCRHQPALSRRRRSPIRRPTRARRWRPSNPAPISRAGSRSRPAPSKPAGTLTLIHRSDRLEEIAAHLVRLGWGELTIKRLPPAARVLVRARRATTPSVDANRRRSCCIGRKAATPTAAEAILRHAAAAGLLGRSPRQCRPC